MHLLTCFVAYNGSLLLPELPQALGLCLQSSDTQKISVQLHMSTALVAGDSKDAGTKGCRPLWRACIPAAVL